MKPVGIHIPDAGAGGLTLVVHFEPVENQVVVVVDVNRFPIVASLLCTRFAGQHRLGAFSIRGDHNRLPFGS